MIVVASAGNAGTETPQYPAAYPGVLAVGATDDLDELYFWSSRGPWVSLTAPGCHMVTDWRRRPGRSAAPSFTPAVVAGVAGLLLSRNPSLTGSQVIAALAYRPAGGRRRLRPGRPRRRVPLARAAGADVGARSGAAAGDRGTTRADTPRPGQLYTRQTLFETGTFRRGFRSTFRVGRGRFEMQLLTPLASTCSLSLRKAGD